MNVQVTVVVVVVHRLVDVDVEAAHRVYDLGRAFGLESDDRVNRGAAE
ncbi:MAG: hypothetical protein WA629_10780 [Candidatus Aquilonibacter sp.]